MNCGVCHRWGLDPALLWLWHWPEATALIRPLALELPYAMGVAIKKKKKANFLKFGVPAVAHRKWNWPSIHEDTGSIPGLAQWVGDPALPGAVVYVTNVVHVTNGMDLMLLWLWCRPATADPIWPLAWEPPYAVGAAVKRPKKKILWTLFSYL